LSYSRKKVGSRNSSPKRKWVEWKPVLQHLLVNGWILVSGKSYYNDPDRSFRKDALPD
jgi:hypothetical protein